MEDKQEQKFHQMTEEPVGRLICHLAFPCIISMLVTSFYNMADTFFVGMLHSDSATGAVGVVYSLMAIIQAVGFFFGHGSGTYISRALGRRQRGPAAVMAANGFFFCLGCGFVIMAGGFLFMDPHAAGPGRHRDGDLLQGLYPRRPLRHRHCHRAGLGPCPW